MIEITRNPIEPQAIVNKVRKSAYGAVVTFLGTIRDNSEGKKVLHLEYDAYPEMAKKKLGEVAAEIKARWGLEDVAIVHRIGRIEVGDIALVIAIGAPHRREAFQACQYAIDRIKEVVPIWKKEFYDEGSAWIG